MNEAPDTIAKLQELIDRTADTAGVAIKQNFLGCRVVDVRRRVHRLLGRRPDGDRLDRLEERPHTRCTTRRTANGWRVLYADLSQLSAFARPLS
jgi:hypothetical protein